MKRSHKGKVFPRRGAVQDKGKRHWNLEGDGRCWHCNRPAEEKTAKMRAKSQALDVMINSRAVTDYASNTDEIEKELEKITVQSLVEEELAKLKSQGT